jgi:hypothetical protein
MYLSRCRPYRRFGVLASVVLTSVFSINGTNICRAQSTAEDDMWSDWQMTISASSLQQYLDYPGSSLHNVSDMKIAWAQPAGKASNPYEDLWYSESTPIGCKRWQALGITPGTGGVVRILNTNPAESGAVANAVLRICLDLALTKCMLKYIVVPRPVFKDVVAALSHPGLAPSPGRDEDYLISLYVISDDGVESSRFVVR